MTGYDWQTVRDLIMSLLGANAYGSDGSPVRRGIVLSALQVADGLMTDNIDAPHDLYALPNGNIILEWQRDSGVIERLEVEGLFKGELMRTFPDAPAEFHKLNWNPTRGAP